MISIRPARDTYIGTWRFGEGTKYRSGDFVYRPIGSGESPFITISAVNLKELLRTVEKNPGKYIVENDDPMDPELIMDEGL